jgi:hypothetical protein
MFVDSVVAGSGVAVESFDKECFLCCMHDGSTVPLYTCAHIHVMFRRQAEQGRPCSLLLHFLALLQH